MAVRDRVIQVRVTDDEKRLFEKCARSSGMSLSDLIRSRLISLRRCRESGCLRNAELGKDYCLHHVGVEVTKPAMD